jgi:hypothetical protein
MTNFTPTRARQDGDIDLGGTHRLTEGFGWSEVASGSERSHPIFQNEAREMGEPAWGVDSAESFEVGGPQDLELMPVAVIKLGLEKETAPEPFGGMLKVPLLFLSTNSAT